MELGLSSGVYNTMYVCLGTASSQVLHGPIGCRIRKYHLNYIDSRDFWESFVKSRHIKTCIYKQVLELAVKLMVFIIIIFSDQSVYATMAMIMRFLYFQISFCVCYNGNDNEVFIFSDQPVYIS